MINRLMIAGFGGQGVMMIGKLIGQCAMEQDLNATFFPSYGAEQRGGTANCTVIQSDRMIGSPTSGRLDVLCALNQPSMVDFLPRLRPFLSTVPLWMFPLWIGTTSRLYRWTLTTWPTTWGTGRWPM